MSDAEFLNWVADRLVHVYGESENVDFVLKLRRLAKEVRSTREGVAEAVRLLQASRLS